MIWFNIKKNYDTLDVMKQNQLRATELIIIDERCN